MHSDAMADDGDDVPWRNDGCDGDGTGRDLLVLPASEGEAAAEEVRLDALGGGTFLFAKRRSVDREMTCVIKGGTEARNGVPEEENSVNNQPGRAISILSRPHQLVA